MYSILLKTNATSDKFSYYLKNDGQVYTTDSLTALGEKVAELLKTYTLGQIVPIKNCIIQKNIEITEAV
jgi:hypothetical protein